MLRSGRVAFIAIFLTGFLIIQFALIQGTRQTLAAYREPFLGWSTHSMLTETRLEAVSDGDLTTFWSDSGRLDPGTGDSSKPAQPPSVHYEGLYIMLSPGMTHRPGRIPEADPIVGIELFTGDTAGLGRPSRIRLSYFEQQLYHINHDYKFPDPPVFVSSIDVPLRDTADGQRVALSLPTIAPSKGFPDQVKQRWMRIEVLGLYGTGINKNENRAALREVRFIRERGRP